MILILLTARVQPRPLAEEDTTATILGWLCALSTRSECIACRMGSPLALPSSEAQLCLPFALAFCAGSLNMSLCVQQSTRHKWQCGRLGGHRRCFEHMF